MYIYKYLFCIYTYSTYTKASFFPAFVYVCRSEGAIIQWHFIWKTFSWMFSFMLLYFIQNNQLNIPQCLKYYTNDSSKVIQALIKLNGITVH